MEGGGSECKPVVFNYFDCPNKAKAKRTFCEVTSRPVTVTSCGAVMVSASAKSVDLSQHFVLTYRREFDWLCELIVSISS